MRLHLLKEAAPPKKKNFAEGGRGDKAADAEADKEAAPKSRRTRPRRPRSGRPTS